MKKSIERAVRGVRAATEKYWIAVAKTQSECPHKNLMECTYKPLHYGCLRPLRVCEDCGLSEEGWGCGYVVLTGDAYPANREEIYAKRHGLVLTQDSEVHGRLLRKETTVRQLAKEWLRGKADV